MFARSPDLHFAQGKGQSRLGPAGAAERDNAAWLNENAQVTEWLMVADCKSAALRSYGGSNPPLCTRILNETAVGGLGRVRRADGSDVDHDRRSEIPVGGAGDTGDVCGEDVEPPQETAA